VNILENVASGPADKVANEHLSDANLAHTELHPAAAIAPTEKNRQKSVGRGLRQINVRARPDVHVLLRAIARAEPTTLANVLRQKLKKLEPPMKPILPGRIILIPSAQ